MVLTAPGCAWGEKDEPGRFRFCENGAKAVNWEATSKRVDADIFCTILCHLAQ